MNPAQDAQVYANSSSNSAYAASSLSPAWEVPHNIYGQSPFIPPAESLHSYASQSAMPGNVVPDMVDTAPANPKLPIPRLKAGTSVHGRRRSARACEPCRQRKTKCDGNRPTCGQCEYHNNHCGYEDVKRVRDQKMLGFLTQRAERFESLLRGLEGEVNAPTARRIRRALKVKDGKSTSPRERDADDSDSSMGSLEAMGLVDEDLNRNENTRAAGFYGKSSEVSWMQRLEDQTEQKERRSSGDGSGSPRKSIDESFQGTGVVHRHQKLDVPISLMNYHLDDLKIPLVQDVDAFDIPPKDVADEYFNAYMTYVHPFYGAIRKRAFTAQYRQLQSQQSKPPKKWLAILNMVFAIGCRYCKFLNPSNKGSQDDLLFLTRARVLCLPEGVLFEHTDLQQIQLEFLVAVYMLCLGQVNRASKFSGMALRSALSLGINLRLTDDKTHNASKEARCRLWWSIYSLEHHLISMHGRASCIGESLCAVPPPIPLDEESFEEPEVRELLTDQTYRETQLRSTLFETQTQLQKGPPWTSLCTPCPSLFFSYLVDLTLISQAVLSKVYSIEGVREGTSQTEWRLQIYSLRMDRWLSNLPTPYQFTTESGPWHVDHTQLDENLPFARERVCLAMSYYSARITLCRPCLTEPRAHTPQNQPSLTERSLSRIQRRADMATQCIQAACSLISILPDEPDPTWLARLTPWWSVLHFLMQATTVLLLALSHSHCAETVPNGKIFNHNNNSSHFPPLLEGDLATAISQTLKALRWIHTMAVVDPAARRAFLLCDGLMRKIAPGINVNLGAWPGPLDFDFDPDGGGGGKDNENAADGHGVDGDEMKMGGLDGMVDFERGWGGSDYLSAA